MVVTGKILSDNQIDALGRLTKESLGVFVVEGTERSMTLHLGYGTIKLMDFEKGTTVAFEIGGDITCNRGYRGLFGVKVRAKIKDGARGNILIPRFADMLASPNTDSLILLMGTAAQAFSKLGGVNPLSTVRGRTITAEEIDSMDGDIGKSKEAIAAMIRWLEGEPHKISKKDMLLRVVEEQSFGGENEFLDVILRGEMMWSKMKGRGMKPKSYEIIPGPNGGRAISFEMERSAPEVQLDPKNRSITEDSEGNSLM